MGSVEPYFFFQEPRRRQVVRFFKPVTKLLKRGVVSAQRRGYTPTVRGDHSDNEAKYRTHARGASRSLRHDTHAQTARSSWGLGSFVFCEEAERETPKKMWKRAARSALTALTGGGAQRGAAAVDAHGLGVGRVLGLGTYYGCAVGVAAATGVGSHQHHHARHYAKAAKGGKQMKRKGASATPQAPTNASMKAAVDKHVSDTPIDRTADRVTRRVFLPVHCTPISLFPRRHITR